MTQDDENLQWYKLGYEAAEKLYKEQLKAQDHRFLELLKKHIKLRNDIMHIIDPTDEFEEDE